jgi:hypothetical protein
VPGTLALAGGLAVLAVASWGARRVAAVPVAVVVDSEAVVRDAASVAASERHRLKPGVEVAVQRRYGGFLLVEDGMGRRGWIAEGTALIR